MTIEEMRQRKIELGYSYEQISLLSGLPLGTVQKVLGGVTKAPRYDTLKALEAVFEPSKQLDMICEPESAYKRNMKKKQGEYTLEDYFAWPEEKRVELIDGEIYDMGSPTDIHQIIAFQINLRFFHYIQEHKGECIPVMSPIDVQLDEDDRTMVQPDIAIVCDRNKFRNGRIFGAPDLIVEVLSPSTRKKDMTKKMTKYFAAGVKEYWIVDSKDKRIIVYSDMDDEDVDLAIYTFEDIVPVKMYAGECKVNFKEIYDYVRFLYKE